MGYLLDTNICIYVLKRKYLQILDAIQQAGLENIFLSTVTVAEMEYGFSRSTRPQEEQQRFYDFIAPFGMVDFNLAAAKHYGRIRAHLARLGTPIGGMDMQIAAIALANDLTVVTNNTREFVRVPNLRVENWTQDGGSSPP